MPTPRDHREWSALECPTPKTTVRLSGVPNPWTLTPVSGVPPWIVDTPESNTCLRGTHVSNARPLCDPCMGSSSDLNRTLVFRCLYGDPTTVTPVSGVHGSWTGLNRTLVCCYVYPGPHDRNASQWCDPMDRRMNCLNRTLVFCYEFGDPTSVTPVTGVTPRIADRPESNTRVLFRVRGPHARNASQWCDPMDRRLK